MSKFRTKTPRCLLEKTNIRYQVFEISETNNRLIRRATAAAKRKADKKGFVPANLVCFLTNNKTGNKG